MEIDGGRNKHSAGTQGKNQGEEAIAMSTPSVLTTTEVIGENNVIQQILTLFGCNNMGSQSGRGNGPLATLEHDVSCVIVGIVNALDHHTMPT
jgi:hypothetical protein